MSLAKDKTSAFRNVKYSPKRNLVYPEAIKATPETISYSKSILETNLNLDIKNARVYISTLVPSYLYYCSLSPLDNSLYFNVIDWTSTTSSGGYSIMTTIHSNLINSNDCATRPILGNKEISLPFAYMKYTATSWGNPYDYIAIITTGLESGSVCSGVYGRYYLYISNFSVVPGDFIPFLTTQQGIVPFYDPNTLGLGLPAFSGYTKVVDTIFRVFTPWPYSYSTYQPRVLTLTFYEDT